MRPEKSRMDKILDEISSEADKGRLQVTISKEVYASERDRLKKDGFEVKEVSSRRRESPFANMNPRLFRIEVSYKNAFAPSFKLTKNQEEFIMGNTDKLIDNESQAKIFYLIAMRAKNRNS